MTDGWVDFLTGPWGFAFAFAAGVLSFLSPCVLPLVPAYLAHLTGTTATLEPGRSARRETVAHAASFVLGFTAVFTFLGASVGLLGSYVVQDHLSVLEKAGGVFLIVLGLNLLGVIKIPILYRTYTLETATAGAGTLALAGGPGGVAIGGRLPHGLAYAKSFGVGSAFAVGWTPCIGPVLGAILGWSATSASVAKGTYLLLAYSLGLGLPFIITGLAVVPVTAFLRRMRGAMPLVEIATGALVIFVGILLFSDRMTMFNGAVSNIPGLDRFNTI